MDAKSAGRLLILAAAVMWSSSGLFAKAPLFADWPLQLAGLPVRGPLLALWRAVFAGLVLLPFIRRPRWRWGLLPMLLAYSAMNYAFLAALTLTTEANAIWLQHTAPVWIFLVGVFVFREPVHPRDPWLLVCCLAGVGLILGCELRGQAVAGIVFGLLGSVTYGAVVLSLRQLRDEDGAWLVFLNNLVTVLLFLPLGLYYGLWPTGGQMLALSVFGAFQIGIPYLLFARGLRRVSGHEAAGIVLLEPILVPLWVYLAWRHVPSYEAPQWWTLVGGGLILLGLALRYIGRCPRTSKMMTAEQPPVEDSHR